MGFFDELLPVPQPQAKPARPRQPPWVKPRDVIGAGVAAEVVLVRTADVAVAVTGLLAFPTGFEYTLTAVLRRERDGRRFGPGMRQMFRGFGDEPLLDEFLRFGVRFSDGRVATNLVPHHLAPEGSESGGPVLVPQGGGGGGRGYDMRHWVWPLPPDGPLTFVCQWPAFGAPESSASIDARLIREAAARAIPLWPEDDESGTRPVSA